MLKTTVRSILLFAVLVLAGCATGAKQEAMVPQLAPATSAKTNAKYQSAIAVRNVTGGKRTNPLWVSSISSEDYASSLTSSLKSRGYHSTSGPYQLDVTLVNVKQPLIGVNFTVVTIVKYVIQDADGKTVFDKTITGAYTAKFSDALIAVQRLRFANEGSARNNIKKFLDELSQS